MEGNDDTALVARLRQGDTAAFEEVYERLRPAVFGYLVRMCGRRDLAEDLLQDTFVRLAERAPDLAEGTRLLCWLFTVARNLFVSQYRRHRTWCELARAEDPWFAPREGRSPLAAAADGATARALERALMRLPPQAREAIVLTAGEMLRPREAAEVLGISAEAFRQRLSRARAQLDAELGKTGEGREER